MSIYSKRRSRVLISFIIFMFIIISSKVDILNLIKRDLENIQNTGKPENIETSKKTNSKKAKAPLAKDVLSRIEVKGRAPKTGYSRGRFTDSWNLLSDSCNTREAILRRDLTNISLTHGCKVLSGTLRDPYTDKIIHFNRGERTSAAIQIDHVVALSNAWQTGAQNISYQARNKFANDPLNLLAVDGPANQQKGDGDAATWLPKNKSFRCDYIARQILVKKKYHLWVVQPEKEAMLRILKSCPEQKVPRP